MKKEHLYNSKFGKVTWFIERFGAKEIFLKPLRTAFAPIIIPALHPAKFPFKQQELEYFYHAYNMTWASERGVEVPIARYYTAQHPANRILEIGNVLAHYGKVEHTILDKFEKYPGVINEDVITFRPKQDYDLVISISTFEHIGFDDESESSSSEKILEALRVARRFLSPKGQLVITVPISYNPELNALIRSNQLGAHTEIFLKRTGMRQWKVSDREEALACKYKKPFPYANALLVAEFDRI